MDSSLVPSLSEFVDETNDDFDDAETMTAAQVLAKLEEVTSLITEWFDDKAQFGELKLAKTTYLQAEFPILAKL